MCGADSFSENLFTMVRFEEFVPADHPLRPIRTWVNDALAGMNAKLSAMYEADIKGGRPSIAPEKLMRVMLLQVLCSVRGERQVVEQIRYNLLFRWFVGLSIDDTVWNHSVFSKNRDRLIEHDAVTELFSATVEMAGKRGLLSGEHFSVDGTAERDAAADMLRDLGRAGRRVTVAADKAYDTRGFVKTCRELKVTPHVAQNTARNGGSAIDARTTRHTGYRISQRKRKCIEQCFGWGKVIGPIR